MAEEQSEDKKPKIDVKKLMSIGFVVMNLAGVGLGTYLTYAGTLGYKTPKATEEELNKELVEFRKNLDEIPIMYAMDTFNTNLDGLPRRFIRIEVNVEMYNKEGFEELVTLGGESKDAITKILNSKKFNDIETVQGKLHLKNEVISHLNDSLKHGVVKNIYFSKFQVQ